MACDHEVERAAVEVARLSSGVPKPSILPPAAFTTPSRLPSIPQPAALPVAADTAGGGAGGAWGADRWHASLPAAWMTCVTPFGIILDVVILVLASLLLPPSSFARTHPPTGARHRRKTHPPTPSWLECSPHPPTGHDLVPHPPFGRVVRQNSKVSLVARACADAQSGGG